MIDARIKTLITVANCGSYTKAAQVLNLTQPAVSHHIRYLEDRYHIKIFLRDKNELKLTNEGAILLKYARRAAAIAHNARQAIEDVKRQVHHLSIGMTQTAGENLMPQVLGIYCDEHPQTHINICTGTIQNLHEMLKNYEIDVAVVEGKLPDPDFTSVLLDTDYLCLIVSPEHPFAKRSSVSLSELRAEKLILRSAKAGTRALFDSFLLNNSATIKSLNVIMEMDNVSMIKELVSMNMGISIVAHSACKADEQAGRLSVVPIANANMTREINMVYYNKGFSHTEVLEDFRRIYNRLQ